MPFSNISMNFISGQKVPSYHKDDLFADFPDSQAAVSFSLGERGW